MVGETSDLLSHGPIPPSCATSSAVPLLVSNERPFRQDVTQAHEYSSLEVTTSPGL